MVADIRNDKEVLAADGFVKDGFCLPAADLHELEHTMPVAPLKLVALPSAANLSRRINEYLEIDKEFDEDLGIEFENGLMDEYRRCRNRCIFCFIDQMPAGMRDVPAFFPLFQRRLFLFLLCRQPVLRLTALSRLYIYSTRNFLTCH